MNTCARLRSFFVPVLVPLLVASSVPLAVACGGIVQGGGGGGGGGAGPDTGASGGAGDGASGGATGGASGGGSGGTVGAPSDVPDDPSLAVPVPGTATVTAPACTARYDACAGSTTSDDAWAKGIVTTCAAKTGAPCGRVDFLRSVDDGCVDHVVFDDPFPPAFVACVVTKAKALRCGPPRPIPAGRPFGGSFVNVCP